MNKALFFIIILQSVSIIFILAYFGFLHPVKSTDVLTTTKNITPTPEAQKLEMTGWLAAWDQEKASKALPKPMPLLQTFAPMFYRISTDGSLGKHAISNKSMIINLAQDAGVPIAPVITDESDPRRVDKLLSSASVQEKFIASLVTEAKKENFIGWSIDIEQLEGKDRLAFSTFIKNAAMALHTNNLKLFVIVYARDLEETYDPALAHDYQVLGTYADQIQLMTYNYNNDSTGPGGQTPLDWYRDVLKYSTYLIPREKILVGLSTHGYDWLGDTVTGLTYQEAIAIIDRQKAKVHYNSQQSAQVATYKDEKGKSHELWFEDAKTIEEKIKIAMEEFHINKFALWRISAEDTRIWDAISKYK